MAHVRENLVVTKFQANFQQLTFSCTSIILEICYIIDNRFLWQEWLPPFYCCIRRILSQNFPGEERKKKRGTKERKKKRKRLTRKIPLDFLFLIDLFLSFRCGIYVNYETISGNPFTSKMRLLINCCDCHLFSLHQDNITL